jgi:hypothetical protein
VFIETDIDPNDSIIERLRRAPRDLWRAVGITGPESACAAAHAMKGRRFLCRDAPALPLAGCDSKKCQCSYRRFADRRRAPRRSEDKGLLTRPVEEDRRGRRGRRETDVDD